jgi:hypothetical protein
MTLFLTVFKFTRGPEKIVPKFVNLAKHWNLMVRKGYSVGEGIELYPGGAALLTEENVVVIADLHLGCEAALEYQGLSLPRVQTKKIEQYIKDTISSLAPRKVVVAGDLKHNFSRNLIQEWNDVARFIGLLRDIAPLEVVKGNHDNYLASILADYGIPLRRSLEIGRFRILHGHSGERVREPCIIGHIHPSIRLRDDIGASIKDHCYLYNPQTEMLVLPALSIVASGLDVVSQAYSDRASPQLPEDGLVDFVPVAFSKDRALRFPTIGELRAVV